jgi:metal-sulfur cluster biosynthetic enzyme
MSAASLVTRTQAQAQAQAAQAGPLTPTQAVEARLWTALRDVEDPEIPISVVGMGLIVSIAYLPAQRAVDLQLTYTAMGCPAMEFIEDDIRERLLREPEVDEVRIEVVWDPLWTRSRIREDARATMRGLGIVA